MRYYFLGIAGTAMGSLAVLLKKKGHEVWGTDQGVYPPMSDFLREQGIPVWEGYAEEHLETAFDVAVIGNAMTRGNVEVEAILNRRLPFISLPELIRNEFIRTHQPIVITGTHGKTTTTTLVSWLLHVAGLSPTFLIGGIARNFNTSVQLGSGKHFVIEGDEYDCAFFDKRPKFVHYFPQYLIINNIEFDHADIYPDLKAIQAEFRKLLRIIPGQGLVVANSESPALAEILDRTYSRVQMFGKSRQNHWAYEILSREADFTEFRVFQNGAPVPALLRFPFPGEFQIQNATAAIAVARDIGIEWESIARGLETFQGVKRRMEYWGTFQGAAVFDDFAHHPTAIAVTLNAMRRKYPGRRLVALFEPRTNTSVRNYFQNELAAALGVADVVVLCPLHRLDRIPQDERLSLERLLADLRKQQRTVISLSAYGEIIPALQKVLKKGDHLVLLTNGSLGGEYQKLQEMVNRESEGRKSGDS